MKSPRIVRGIPSLALLLSVALIPMRADPAQAQGMSEPLAQLSGDAFDQAFLHQMIMHHAMAVMMAQPVVEYASRQELRDLARNVIVDQSREIDQMRRWLRDWYGMEVPDPLMMNMTPMAPMPMGDMGHEGMAMEGMGQTGMPMGQMHEMSMVADLWALPAPRLEAVFMSMMVPHHEGAIVMAALAPDRAAHAEVRELAQNIISSQSTEITQMNRWLADWYGL